MSAAARGKRLVETEEGEGEGEGEGQGEGRRTGRVLVVVNDERTCYQLKQVCCVYMTCISHTPSLSSTAGEAWYALSGPWSEPRELSYVHISSVPVCGWAWSSGAAVSTILLPKVPPVPTGRGWSRGGRGQEEEAISTKEGISSQESGQTRQQ